MSPNSNLENESPKPSNETEIIRKPVVPETTDASENSDPDRSPGKTDRDITASISFSTPTQESKVIRDIITPELISELTDSDKDRSPGKTDRDLTIE